MKKGIAFCNTLIFLKLLGGINANALFVLAYALKLDGTVDKSEECVVGADADVVAGMDMSSSLANKNVAGQNKLTVSTLYTKTLGLGVTAVLCRTNTFFMCKKLQA